MFSPFAASQRSGRFCPSATPEARGPRNDGQLPAAGAAAGIAHARRRRGPDDLPDRHHHGFAARAPDAAIHDHPPRSAVVGDQVERDVAGLVHRHAVARGLVASARGVAAGQELDLAAVALPGALERRPAGALDGKDAVATEARGEAAELQRLGRHRGRGCPATERIEATQTTATSNLQRIALSKAAVMFAGIVSQPEKSQTAFAETERTEDTGPSITAEARRHGDERRSPRGRPSAGRRRVRRYANASHARSDVARIRVPAYPSAARSAARRTR